MKYVMEHVENIYGDGIVGDELSKLDKYIVITDRIAWDIYKDYFKPEPTEVIFPDTLEKSELERMEPKLPNHAAIVGLGGGSVLDAAKYFAFLKKKHPVLVPTITSSNAPHSDWMSVRRDGRAAGIVEPGYARKIIIDYDLIRKADPRLNRAGYGDLLFMLTTIKDWQLAAAAGKGPAIDTAIIDDISNLMQSAISKAEAIGSVTDKGIEDLMKFFEVSTAICANNSNLPLGAGAEHLFAWNLEGVTGRHFIHGEIVALGIVISSFLQKSNHDLLKKALNTAKVAYHPETLGITWEEIEETLKTVEIYNRNVRKFNTVFSDVVWSPELLQQIRDMI